MSKILVLGPTGLGKSTSLRNLNSEETAIINCDRKELPIHGWRAKYKTEKDATGKIQINKSNYFETANSNSVLTILKELENVERIKNIVIDTITHMITHGYMTTTIGKDFKAYQALGKSFYDIIDHIQNSKKNIIVYGHIERKIGDMGEIMWEMKSHGKMITDLVPPSYFTTVFIAEKVKEDDKFKFVFRTQSDGNDPAKSPARISPTGDVEPVLQLREPNDIAAILQKLDDFESGT